MKEVNLNEIKYLEEPEAEQIKYLDEPKTTLESIGETTSDVARGVGSGLTMGGLEELIAAGQATISPEEDEWSKKYKKFLEIQEQKTKEAKERSPTGTFVGEVGGALLPALLTGGAGLAASGGKAAAALGGKELLKAAAKGALFEGITGTTLGGVTGGLSSEGGLIGASEEEKQKYWEDVKSGALTGGVIGGAFGAAGPIASGVLQKTKEKLSELPLMKEIKESFEMGKTGKGFLTEKAARDMLIEEERGISSLATKLKTMDKLAAEKVTKPLEQATFDGVMVPMLRKEPFEALATEVQAKQPELAYQLKRLANNQITPIEAHELRNTIKSMGPEYRELENEIKAAIDKAVPGYKDNLYNFSKFRQATSESLIKKGTPIELRDTWLSDLTKPKENLLSSVENTIHKLKSPGTDSRDAIASLYSEKGGMFPLLDKLKTSNYGSELEDLSKQAGFKNADDFINSIRNEFEDKALKSSTIGSALGGRPEQEGIHLKTSFTRKPLVIGGNLAGQAKKMTTDSFNEVSKLIPNILKKPIQAATTVYDFPEVALDKMADMLVGNQKFSSYGKSLKDALSKKDNVKKEAILFALMQQPDFREIVPSMMGVGEKNE